MNLERRVGRFNISRTLIRDHPELVFRIMGKCIIVSCQLHWQDYLEYVALSPEFNEIREGEMAPLYNIQANSDGTEITFSLGEPSL